MITHELLLELQRLDRDEKLKILRLLANELSIDIGKYFEDRSAFKVSPPFRAPDAAVTLLERLEEDAETNG